MRRRSLGPSSTLLGRGWRSSRRAWGTSRASGVEEERLFCRHRDTGNGKDYHCAGVVWERRLIAGAEEELLSRSSGVRCVFLRSFGNHSPCALVLYVQLALRRAPRKAGRSLSTCKSRRQTLPPSPPSPRSSTCDRPSSSRSDRAFNQIPATCSAASPLRGLLALLLTRLGVCPDSSPFLTQAHSLSSSTAT